MKIIYARIQTNRFNIKKYWSTFKVNKLLEETFVAPRPLHGRIQATYYALVTLIEDSKNYQRAIQFPNFTAMNKNDWETQLKDIQYSWTA